MKTVKIDGLIKNNRISTQDLLLEIQEKINEGYTDFEINACGQHDIGGSSWAKDKNKNLTFTITNPGQRVGAMARKGTTIYVQGSTPADIGWLNSGADIIGINHRNLDDFSMDMNLCEKLIPQIPNSKIIIAERGLEDKDFLRHLQNLGVDAFLIGEYFMRQNDEGEALKALL